MEHLIQFGVNIDDEALKKAIMVSASNVVIKEVKDQLCIGADWRRSDRVRQIISDEVLKWLNDNSEAILDLSAKLVSEKVMRSKAMKEKIINQE
ncbi:MAG: hypothetical protein KBS66_07495 [Eubacterium sp.]|nr:hypothetical protein [Candidatus Colimonas fimequi]